MHPDWLGSPQHFVAGAVLTAAVMWVGRSRVDSLWLLCVLAVGVTCAAELVVELLEYPLLYADHFHRSAYDDTLADMADTLAGAVVAAILVAAVLRRRG